jgi:hypothetical protein
MRQLLLATVLATACASKDALLRQLATDLGSVRAASSEDHPEVSGPKDLRPLRGVSLADIRAALGRPDCESAHGGPCMEDADLVYEYFKLPEGWLGGGPNLLVWTDAAGRCRDAMWLGTK